MLGMINNIGEKMGVVKYKVVDLFGCEREVVAEASARTQTDMHDYEGFVDKFTPKKTTDDCYTPPEAFGIVLDYVRERCCIEGAEIVRPFYPGGDFESVPYTKNMVVIDNPPFSIIAKICRFYIKNGIRFFLFGPHLTAFSSDLDVTHIIASADITYENGATIKTSFISNMFGDLKIIAIAASAAATSSIVARRLLLLLKSSRYVPSRLSAAPMQSGKRASQWISIGCSPEANRASR